MTITGLTSKEVQKQIELGNVNTQNIMPTRSIKNILFTNIFNLFNMLNFCLGFIIFLTGSYKNLLFLGTVFCNTAISIFQEIKSKKEVDKLTIIASPKALVIRDNEEVEIDIYDVVLKDVIKYKIGNEVSVDSTILNGSVMVSEAFITGESDYIAKKTGDTILSGSFIVSGSCTAKVIHIKEDNYVAKISKDAKYVKKLNSVLLNSLNKIIKFIAIFIVPLGLILFYNQYYSLGNPLKTAVVNSVAALIAMIPEGLILLTSTVLAVSTIRLSKRQVLVKRLFSIESLARVDTICFDKTGTLTTGKMKVSDVIIINKKYDINEIMNNICGNFENENATMNALKNYFQKHKYTVVDDKDKISFSSDKKYSSIIINNEKYLLGAPEIILKRQVIDLSLYDDKRILLLAKKIKTTEALAYIIIEDEIRTDAKKTINYFQKQGVDVKIISGDNPNTVVKILNKLGLKNNSFIDCSNLSDAELKNIILNTNVFGRVSPFQKKLIITYLKENGRNVAMVGDGVNDVLALKESDCSIALPKSSDCATNVADLVLLSASFAAIPYIVEEGRTTINNTQKSASLFLLKTIYAILLGLIFCIIPYKYPFIPIQLTLTSSLTIGIPSFILSLSLNKNKVSGNFLSNVLRKAIVPALVIVLDILILTFMKFNEIETSTMAITILGIISFYHIYLVCRPLKKGNLTMLSILAIAFIIGLTCFKNLFNFSNYSNKMIIVLAVMSLCSILFINLLFYIKEMFNKKYLKEK